MTIEEIIQLTRNKLQNILINRDLAFSRGDIETVTSLDSSILITKNTLILLETLTS